MAYTDPIKPSRFPFQLGLGSRSTSQLGRFLATVPSQVLKISKERHHDFGGGYLGELLRGGKREVVRKRSVCQDSRSVCQDSLVAKKE